MMLAFVNPIQNSNSLGASDYVCSLFTTTGADASGAQHRLKPVLVTILLENAREF